MGIAAYEFTKALPKQLKGGMPTIEELEQELEKEIEEFKEQIDPVNARLKTIKERLKGMNQDETQTVATYPVLIKLYKESLKPLYKELIKRLGVFEEEFYLTSYGWEANVSNANDMATLDLLMNEMKNMKNVREIEFFYDLWGFKKGEVECYNEHLLLTFIIQDYWYGFTLKNYNNHKLFFKKMYHQPLDKKDIQKIIDVMMNIIMDRMEPYLEKMN